MCWPPTTGHMDSFQTLNSVARSGERVSPASPRAAVRHLAFVRQSLALPFRGWPRDQGLKGGRDTFYCHRRQRVSASNVDSPFPSWLKMAVDLKCVNNIRIQLLFEMPVLCVISSSDVWCTPSYRHVFGFILIQTTKDMINNERRTKGQDVIIPFKHSNTYSYWQTNKLILTLN